MFLFFSRILFITMLAMNVYYTSSTKHESVYTYNGSSSSFSSSCTSLYKNPERSFSFKGFRVTRKRQKQRDSSYYSQQFDSKQAREAEANMTLPSVIESGITASIESHYGVAMYDSSMSHRTIERFMQRAENNSRFYVRDSFLQKYKEGKQNETMKELSSFPRGKFSRRGSDYTNRVKTPNGSRAWDKFIGENIEKSDYFFRDSIISWYRKRHRNDVTTKVPRWSSASEGEGDSSLTSAESLTSTEQDEERYSTHSDISTTQSELESGMSASNSEFKNDQSELEEDISTSQSDLEEEISTSQSENNGDISATSYSSQEDNRHSSKPVMPLTSVARNMIGSYSRLKKKKKKRKKKKKERGIDSLTSRRGAEPINRNIIEFYHSVTPRRSIRRTTKNNKNTQRITLANFFQLKNRRTTSINSRTTDIVHGWIMNTKS